MARTANVSPPSLPAVSATQMLQTRTPSAHLMRGGNQDEGMEEKDDEDEDEKKDDDVCRCLASCRCKFCPESSNSGLGQGRDDKVAVESCLAVPQPILNAHCVSLHHLWVFQCRINILILPGAQPAPYVCHRHDEVGETRQRLDLQPHGQGGREQFNQKYFIP